jgi:hypothetical protein
MKLPNAELAIIDEEKIRDYFLSMDHPRRKHKARVFQSALGLAASDTDDLIAVIKKQINCVSETNHD